MLAKKRDCRQIYIGAVKGYLSDQRRKVVFSKVGVVGGVGFRVKVYRV